MAGNWRQALGLEDPQAAGAEENTASFEIYPLGMLPLAELEALRCQLLDHVMPFLRGYIWQRDRFSLQLSSKRQAPWQRARTRRGGAWRRGDADAAQGAAAAAGDAPPPHLWGSLSFGDNVEDEWFAVWLLLELTRAFPVTARVWDNDGEFLLIEAAYGLPRWLKPETAQNRLWLHAGGVHLVPLPRFAGDPLLAATPSLEQALSAVRGGEVDTQAPAKLQAALAPRLSGYPARAAEQMHVARALVPARVAHLLRREPQLLAAAVEAFHYRDPDDVKVAARMAAFPPSDLVLAAPTFSRCLYAQLALQEHAPPRGYPMPMPTDPQYKAAEVGLKLTAGFEMMLASRARFGRRPQEQQEQQEQGQEQAEPQQAQEAGGAAEAALRGDPAWAAFRARLEAAGYFRGSLPGSARHSELLAAAVGSYRGSEAYRRGTAALAAPALRVEELLREPADPASLPPPGELPPEGSEAWLVGDEAGRLLEAELEQRQRELAAHQARREQRRGGAAAQQQRGAEQQGGGGGGEGFDPENLARQLRAFVDMAAGLEGAELPPGLGADGGEGVALDEAAFAAELQRVLGLSKAALRGLGGGGDDDSGSESSDEGSSFFSDNASSASHASDAEEEDEGQQQRAAAAAEWQARQAAGGAAPAARAQQPAAAAAAAQPAGSGSEGEDDDDASRRVQEAWEADTATDSDDAEFMEAYGQAMDAQLAGTRMVESFERAPTPAGPAAAAGQQQQAGGGAASPQGQGETEEQQQQEEEAPAALRPVDIDVNLVSSLLASYGEQQGLPGPAGTLAGLMGLRLPDPRAQGQR